MIVSRVGVALGAATLLVAGALAVPAQAAPTAAARPAVTHLSTTTGRLTGGGRVTVQGKNFTRVRAVLFGRTKAGSLHVTSSRRLTVMAPARPAGRVDVRVVTSSGTSTITRVDRFTYIAPPRISSISPTVGAASGDTAVTVTGPDVGRATAVRFGGVPATAIRRISATSLRARTPVHALADVHVSVTTPYGTSTPGAADRFRYRTVPDPVGDLRVVAVTGTSVTLRWTPSTAPGTGGVSIRSIGAGRQSSNDLDGPELVRLPDTATEWTDASLKPGFGYSYSVQAYTNTGLTSTRSRLSVTTISQDRPDTLPEPTGLNTAPVPSSGSCQSGEGRTAGWIGTTPTITIAAYVRNTSFDTSPVALRVTAYYTIDTDHGTDRRYLIGYDDPAGLSEPVPGSGGVAAVPIDTALLDPHRSVVVDTETVFADGSPPADRFRGAGRECYLNYDDAVPATPAVSSSDFPHDGSGVVHTGRPGTFQLTYDDVELGGGYSGYDHAEYSLSRDELLARRGTPTPSDGDSPFSTDAEFSVTPTHAGSQTLWVSAVSVAGVLSLPARWDFVVTDPPPPPTDIDPAYPRAGDSDDALHAVACPSTTRCFAFGAGTAASGEESYRIYLAPTVRTWTAGGSSGTWTSTVLPSVPNGYDYRDARIACPSTTSCTVIASYGSGLFVARLDGTTWTVAVDVPVVASSTGSTITALSCPSATSCTAVGQYRNAERAVLPFVSRLAGNAWTTTTLPVPAVDGAPAESAVDAIDCVDATHCQAVGRYATVARTDDAAPTWALLTETLDGTRWSVGRPAIAVDQLPYATIDCTTSAGCTARDGLQGLSLTGSTWTSTGSLPAPGRPLAGPVLCAGSDVCRAIVGDPDDTGTVSTYSGGTWVETVFPAAHPNGGNAISFTASGLTCVDATLCAAVGTSRAGAFTSILTTRSPWYTQYLEPANVQARLLQVSCASEARCLAAGTTVSSEPYLSLLTGATWTHQPVPVPTDAAEDGLVRVYGVSCPSTRWCAVFGQYTDDTVARRTTLFASVLSEGEWTSSRLTPPSDAYYRGGPGQLSCPIEGHCVATASALGGYGFVFTLDHDDWTTTQPDPSHDNGANGDLGAVSCASTTSCLVLTDTAAHDAFRLEGSTWTRVVVPVPTHYAELDAVSCAAPGSCTVVGRGHPDDGSAPAFASTLSNGAWTTTMLPGAESRDSRTPPVHLAVSCTTTSCLAVGRNITGEYPAGATQYAARLTSTGWTELATTTPDATVDPGLAGVSCIEAGPCIAVGQTNYLISTFPLVELFTG